MKYESPDNRGPGTSVFLKIRRCGMLTKAIIDIEEYFAGKYSTFL